MIIRNFYYNEKTQTLEVEFSFKDDAENTYRVDELMFRDIEFYSPTIVTNKDMEDIDDEFVSELLVEFYKHNEPPKEEFL
jgi:hypothetical protein